MQLLEAALIAFSCGHRTFERARCTISTRTFMVSVGLLTSRKNAMRGGFALLQDEDVRIGVLPEGEEILVNWLGGLPERGSGSQASELGSLAIPGIRDPSTGRRPMSFHSLS